MPAGPLSELLFQRTAINLADAARLGDGEDLNDSLLDFFIKLGQYLIPKKGEEAPVAFLGSHFFSKLQSANASSGEEGWKQVSGWAKRKAGGLFKETYGALAITINEELKDDKGKDAGNHWWLAIVLNPPGGARNQPTAVLCMDSMQRREKALDPHITCYMKGAQTAYSCSVSKMEQAGYLVIISFSAKGDGCRGAIPRPEASRLKVDGAIMSNPQLGLRINMPGAEGVQGSFEGTLTFALDGKCRSSVFEFFFAEEGYPGIKLEFDPFNLSKFQKVVSRFCGGYLAKEWETNGPNKKDKFVKMSARALVADVCQQENLNDCGVFALENILRSLAMSRFFLRKMAEASPEVLATFPWPTQEDITSRKHKLKAITARLFAAAAEKGNPDLEVVLKGDAELREEVKAALSDKSLNVDSLEQWSGQLQKELAVRTAEKEQEDEARRFKEEKVQQRRDEEKRKKEEMLKREEEDRRNPRKRSREKKRYRSESYSDFEDNEKNLDIQKFAKNKNSKRSRSRSAKRSRSRSGKRRKRSGSNGKKRKDADAGDPKEKEKREKAQRKAERMKIREMRAKRRAARHNKKGGASGSYSDSPSRSRSRRR